MAKCVVMVGNLNDGYMPVGPFESFDAADEAFPSATNTWIMTLFTPYEYEHYMATGKWIDEETGEPFTP